MKNIASEGTNTQKEQNYKMQIDKKNAKTQKE